MAAMLGFYRRETRFSPAQLLRPTYGIVVLAQCRGDGAVLGFRARATWPVVSVSFAAVALLSFAFLRLALEF